MRKEIGDIPFLDRMAKVESIKNTIPINSMRVGYAGNKLNEVWGFVVLNDLPFCFRVFPSMTESELEFVDGSAGSTKKSHWFVHAPYVPLNFSVPLFTNPIKEEDMEYLLRCLGVEKRETDIKEFYKSSLEARAEDYKIFRELYSKDVSLRLAFVAAVSLACDEKLLIENKKN